jgi:hypothetical protein
MMPRTMPILHAMRYPGNSVAVVTMTGSTRTGIGSPFVYELNTPVILILIAPYRAAKFI